MLVGLGVGGALYAPADMIAMTAQWLAALAAIVLIFSKVASAYYLAEPAHD